MTEFEIGTPFSNMGTIGYIVAKDESRSSNFKSFTIGDGGMQENHAEYVCVIAKRKTIIPDGILAPMVERAHGIARCENPQALVAEAEAFEASSRLSMHEREAARVKAEQDFQAECRAKIPAWAKAVIVAELHKDDCDSMSDYYNYKTTRRVIIGFSRHNRNLFPEMREAAATFEETAHLANAGPEAEHRENYSMGAGMYLKNSSKYRDGWAVNKRVVHNGIAICGVAEWHLPESKPTQQAASVGAFTIEQHVHTKKGFTMWICIMANRVERAEFEALRAKAESMGGWYSKQWGKTPGGFAFKDAATAEAFAGLEGSPPEGNGPATEPPRPSQAKSAGGDHMATKLEALADGMQSAIDDKFRNRLTNTPKRMREAGSARLDGQHLKRTQTALRALATAHRTGTIQNELATLSSKAKVHELTTTKIDRSNSGYYCCGIDTGKPYHETPQALALWTLLGNVGEADHKAEALRREVEKLKFANIPGYFPSPAPIVEMMLDRADIQDGHSVLEPSAGSGNILDAIAAKHPLAESQGFEQHSSLANVCKMKGHKVEQGDFMTWPMFALFDRVLMNPPFENGQDIDHVRRAFDWLKPGGRLVAIMSPGPFYRADRKATEFRAWFDAMAGDRQDIEAGAFKESGTGVATVLVEIRKAG